MTEGNLVRWAKKEGDTIKSGDLLAEIETDKATMEVEAVDEGKLVKILVPEGTQNVQVNKVIAVLLEEDEDESVLESFDIGDEVSSNAIEKSAPEVKTETQPQPKIQTHTQSQPQGGERIIATPLAKRIASQKGVDLGRVQGSGPHGRIVKADVENMTSGGLSFGFGVSQVGMASQPRENGLPPYDQLVVSGMRKVIAQRLTESKQTVPHFYLTIECQVDKLLEARKDINDLLEEGQGKISVNDMVIRACALALRAVPAANAAWFGDHVKQFKTADISVAVAIGGGLITPIIKSAEEKNLLQISVEAKELIGKARDGTLKPEEFQGGTFSLSNLGMYGISHFGAIINPPQGCILAVGAAQDKVVPDEHGRFKAIKIMNCTLSVDHRVVDGAVGSEFLQSFKKYIESPVSLLMG
jgi:pyruvate dehydrogenase E2 component (dihydrolipoamide acetyltransferase)